MDEPLTLPFDEPEIWRDAVGYEGIYLVSNLGRVFSIPRKYSRRGVMLKPIRERDRLHVMLYRDKLGRNHFIHTLVAAAFLGPCPEGMEIAHGPGGSLDNRAWTLKYKTHAENTGPDKVRDGTLACGSRHGKAKLTEAQVVEIRSRHASGETKAALAAEFRVDHSNVQAIVTRKTWRHVA